MNRRRVLGMVGAFALAGMMGVGALAEKTNAAKATSDCCCGDLCCCGPACQEACCCGLACCGESCCCESTTSHPAAVAVESCCEKDPKAAACCPRSAAKAQVALGR